MCGFVVVLERGRPVADERVRAALASIAHRGPDGTATRSLTLPAALDRDLPAVHIGLGHARLAVLDLDPRSNQPFSRGPSTLVYNGEIYNYRDIARDLARRGAHLETTGDTEVLSHLIQLDGIEGLTRAYGMWAFCHIDRVRRRLTAVRDRYGKKPLFYAIRGDLVCFASEIKALLILLGEPARAAADTVPQFLLEGWLFPRRDGATHLEGIREVRPGHAVEVDLETWTLTERHVLPLECEPKGLPTDDETLSEILAEATEMRLVSDRRVGLMLSGGVDSSLILSILAARGHAEGLTCITAEAGKSDDALYARRAMEHLGLTPLIVPLDYGAAGFDDFLDVCRFQEKPFPLIGNVLGAPQLYRVIAGEGIRVLLDGAGSDEIFGGYWGRQAPFAMRDAARAGDVAWIEALKAGGQLSPRIQALDPRLLIDRPPPKPYAHLPTELERGYLAPEIRNQLSRFSPCDPLVALDGTLADALREDALGGRMQEWFWQNDRNAMAYGVENRSPFLDHRLARWMGTGYAAKFSGPWNKREIRRQFARFIELPTATRVEKQGFRWVYGRFFRANRRAVVDMIAASTHARAALADDRLLRAALSGDDVLDHELLHRLTVIAGLETVGMLAPT
jgi:asparagine synthase (glutamine-hydrolysing)